MTEQDGQERPDQKLREALRAAAPEPPLGDVDWDALHERIQAQARPLLARRYGADLWGLFADWTSRPTLLASLLAAALALVVGITLVKPRTTGGADAFGLPTVEEQLVGDLPASTLPLLLANDSAAILDVALFYDVEEW